MPKIQGMSRNSNLIYITVPKEHADSLGWKKGDIVVAESSKKNDTLIFKRTMKG